MKTDGLRFAPLVRVSTEKQADIGESLSTQKKQIEQYVKSLNGRIPENCWIYSGQEHATPEQERQKLELLLSHSGDNRYDCVIVCDTSRWSRDNQKSKEGLSVLRKNRIRFFVGTMEYDLYNPEHNFILGMSAEIGELQATQQSMKSIVNRIERAKRGIPSNGKLPYGRIFNKKTETWGLDEEKAKLIRWAAKQYLEGSSIVKIAKILNMNFSNLWKILTKRSGSDWEIQFKSEKLNINEIVSIKIPALLDEYTIQKIHGQGAANKTFNRNQIKNPYLIGNFIFCKECGYALSGQTNKNGKRYYRHYRNRKKECSIKNWIPANLIESAVFLHLFNMFGDVDRIQKAIEKATPDLNKTNQGIAELEQLQTERKKIIAQRKKLVDLSAKGLLTEKEIEKNITEIRSQLDAIEDRSNYLKNYLKNSKNSNEIKQISSMAYGVMKQVLKSKSAMEKMDYKSKRQLIKHAFSGKDIDGKRLGVYIQQTGHELKPWRFEIKAVLDTIIKSVLPMHESQIEELLGIGEYGNLEAELEKQNFNSIDFALY